jgi:hypothetical protein
MPFMAPMIDGLRKKMMSIVIQVSNDIAVQILVFKTAAPASGDAVYGSYSDNQRLDTLVRELAGISFTHTAVETVPPDP